MYKFVEESVVLPKMCSHDEEEGCVSMEKVVGSAFTMLLNRTSFYCALAMVSVPGAKRMRAQD